MSGLAALIHEANATLTEGGLSDAQRSGEFFLFLLRVIGSFIVSCVVALVAILLLRHSAINRKNTSVRTRGVFGLARITAGIRVLEARRLSPHADVCRFVSGGREYLVLVSSSAATLLRETAVAESQGAADEMPAEGGSS